MAKFLDFDDSSVEGLDAKQLKFRELIEDALCDAGYSSPTACDDSDILEEFDDCVEIMDVEEDVDLEQLLNGGLDSKEEFDLPDKFSKLEDFDGENDDDK